MRTNSKGMLAVRSAVRMASAMPSASLRAGIRMETAGRVFCGVRWGRVEAEVVAEEGAGDRGGEEGEDEEGEEHRGGVGHDSLGQWDFAGSMGMTNKIRLPEGEAGEVCGVSGEDLGFEVLHGLG